MKMDPRKRDRDPELGRLSRRECVHVIEGLRARIQELEVLTAKQKQLVEQLLRHEYGPRADRFHMDQLVFDIVHAIDEGREGEKDEKKEEEPPGCRRSPRKGHGRRLLPPELERRRVEHDATEEEKRCSSCGGEKECIGADVSEQLEYEPASLYVIEHVSKKYACRACEEGVTTGRKPAQPIEKGLAGPGLLAHVAVSKYADHLPLHRQEGILARSGVELTRQTMCGWMESCAGLLLPLYEGMKERVLSSKVVHTDDTPVAVQDDERTRTKTGRIWVYVGDEKNPYTVYDFTPDRTRDGPERFLGKFRGYLQADAYAGYDRLYRAGAVKEVACWAHVRRKYVDAQTSDPVRSVVAGCFIHELYDVEERARGVTPDRRRALRRDDAQPILTKFLAWLRVQKKTVLPKSPMGEAISYTLSNWEALTRYVEDKDLAIDNNKAERALRGIAVGRGNWLFYGSDNGGRTGAILTTFMATCKDHDIDPFRYLRDVFRRLPGHPRDRLAELLPDHWKEEQAKAAA